MTNINALKAPSSFLIKAGFFLAAVALFSLPVFAYAATYAYVNTTGEVRTVTADSADAALATAPGLHIHSGVMLLTNPSDGIVGDNVPVQ